MLGKKVQVAGTTGLRPQDRFANPNAYRLLVDEAFCSFRVDAPAGPGVYAWWVDGELVYIGRAINLRNRLSIQYGRVSPRHPFAGGQIQKSRVNALLNAAFVSGRLVEVSWAESPDYVALEHDFLANHRPPWNMRV